ncbi:MAG TPA: hypothetical protein VGC27_05915, partial [Rhizomicrobium sp.]
MASRRDLDPIWRALRQEAEELASQEHALAGLVRTTVLNQKRLEDALSYHLARKIGGAVLSTILVREIVDQA